jgi:hypothetical protein
MYNTTVIFSCCFLITGHQSSSGEVVHVFGILVVWHDTQSTREKCFGRSIAFHPRSLWIFGMIFQRRNFQYELKILWHIFGNHPVATALRFVAAGI